MVLTKGLWCSIAGRSAATPSLPRRTPRRRRAKGAGFERRRDQVRMGCGRKPWSVRRLVRLGMLTGMRRGELAGLQWSDVTTDRIVLHASGTKSGVRHEVPLTPAMRAVLQAQPRTTSALVFPSARRKAGAQLSGWTQLVAGAVHASGVDFRLHDLRRTTQTLMSRAGLWRPSPSWRLGTCEGLVGIYNKDEHGWRGSGVREGLRACLGSLLQ